MAYFGVQYLGESIPDGVDKALTTMATAFGNDDGPGHWDRARYVDEAGFTNIISIGYWDVPAKFDAWFGDYGAGWKNCAAEASAAGTFIEVLTPTTQRFETLFSSDVPEGVACLADGFSGVVQEHAYWGGARGLRNRRPKMGSSGRGEASDVRNGPARITFLSYNPRFATSAGAPAVPRARSVAPFFPPTLLV